MFARNETRLCREKLPLLLLKHCWLEMIVTKNASLSLPARRQMINSNAQKVTQLSSEDMTFASLSSYFARWSDSELFVLNGELPAFSAHSIENPLLRLAQFQAKQISVFTHLYAFWAWRDSLIRENRSRPTATLVGESGLSEPDIAPSLLISQITCRRSQDKI